ncbi:DUF4307 domain-containing protein [Microbacterium halotolerans]|uniref:DUF4307 domain-containing protein n=1 Tax=Microbacterium halotolerans TaxID=246613 RepID=UPI001F08E13B|nr:DUF4307 domain-containing protein [Microbacterium halotolerans]
MTTTQQMLDERYGRVRRRGRVRAFWLVVFAGALALTGYLAWHTVAGAISTVNADDLGFEVRDETTTSVSFQFTAPVDRDVACILTALDEEFGTVGWKVFEYAADGDHAQRHTEEIPTLSEATTGLVKSCWVL